MAKYVYFFGGGTAEGRADMKALLGGKGANLAEMTRLGLPVPPGFTIAATACDEFFRAGGAFPPGLEAEVERHLKKLETLMGRKLGDAAHPLLVSVRSGAAASMPGMMDTVLNLGLSDESVRGLAARSGNARFAWDAYRRFIAMFGNVVMGVPMKHFEKELFALRDRAGAAADTDLDAAHLQGLVATFQQVYRAHTGAAFPQEPRAQLRRTIEAVFESWHNERAVQYRRLNRITGLLGTGVNVQSMVFGNMGARSGTGVCFTRDPSTGENVFYGEFLLNAQGEDVVAGIRTPEPIALLAQRLPRAYRQLLQIRATLERHYRDMQDLEFTVEDGTLYMLQTRTGKRTGVAAVRIAAEMVRQRLIRPEEAVGRVSGDQLNQVLFPVFDAKAKQAALKAGALLGTGLPAGPGAVSAAPAFTADEAERRVHAGEAVILVRDETSPEDLKGMHVARGILTARGGMTSHAAVVARGMGKTCIVGCKALTVDEHARTLRLGSRTLGAHDVLSLDGATGEILAGGLPTADSEVVRVLIRGTLKPARSALYRDYAALMKTADRLRRLRVRTNADTPHDAAVARKFGAQGIGLCRTEHMFFEGERIHAMRAMIMAADDQARERALADLLPFQRRDFEGIFRAMDGLPVTIRLLDPPLHEFLPHEEPEQREMAARLGLTLAQVRARVAELAEVNPMMGFRGCRLGILYVAITRMQARAIIAAACRMKKRGVDVRPEIMVPLIGTKAELDHQAREIRAVAEAVQRETGVTVPFMVGTMIEVPRAALIAGQVAQSAEFFSFGTNDLTQMTFGYSRDDAGKFIHEYVARDLLPADPFQTLDQTGVGRLVALAVAEGRAARPDLKVGICGEHGGDPDSVKFCHRTGLDYVSCSPYRVAIARLAAAQAVLEAGDAPTGATPARKKKRQD